MTGVEHRESTATSHTNSSDNCAARGLWGSVPSRAYGSRRSPSNPVDNFIGFVGLMMTLSVLSLVSLGRSFPAPESRVACGPTSQSINFVDFALEAPPHCAGQAFTMRVHAIRAGRLASCRVSSPILGL